jgi:hypothetical protein
MGKLLAAALLMGATVAGADSVVAAREKQAEVCAGAPVTPFERRLPEQVHRFAFEGAMLEPFLRLWHSAGRPELPITPESVIVYAAPGRPYVVGYEREGCMIAFLAVPHQELWRWLRPSLGWSAEGPRRQASEGTA